MLAQTEVNNQQQFNASIRSVISYYLNLNGKIQSKHHLCNVQPVKSGCSRVCPTAGYHHIYFCPHRFSTNSKSIILSNNFSLTFYHIQTQFNYMKYAHSMQNNKNNNFIKENKRNKSSHKQNSQIK